MDLLQRYHSLMINFIFSLSMVFTIVPHYDEILLDVRVLHRVDPQHVRRCEITLLGIYVWSVVIDEVRREVF